jgi:hypothetical protein
MTPSRNESYICNSKPFHKRTCIFEKLHINPYFHTLHSISHNSTLTLQLLPLVATFRHIGCHMSVRSRSGLQLEQVAGSTGEKKKEEASAGRNKKKSLGKKLEEKNKMDLNKV